MIDLQCFEASGMWVKPAWAEGANAHVLFISRAPTPDRPGRALALTFDGDRSTDNWPDVPGWAMEILAGRLDALFDPKASGHVSTYGARTYVTAIVGGGGGTMLGTQPEQEALRRG